MSGPAAAAAPAPPPTLEPPRAFVTLLDRLLERMHPPGKRTQPQPPALALVARLSLGGTKSLFVVQFDGQRFLVASGGDSVTWVQPLAAADRGSESGPEGRPGPGPGTGTGTGTGPGPR